MRGLNTVNYSVLHVYTSSSDGFVAFVAFCELLFEVLFELLFELFFVLSCLLFFVSFSLPITPSRSVTEPPAISLAAEPAPLAISDAALPTPEAASDAAFHIPQPTNDKTRIAAAEINKISFFIAIILK